MKHHDPLGWLWHQMDRPRIHVPSCDVCPRQAVDYDPRTGATRCGDHPTRTETVREHGLGLP